MNVLYEMFGTYAYGMFICLGLLLCVMVVMQFVITSAHRRRKKFEKERAEAELAASAQIE